MCSLASFCIVSAQAEGLGTKILDEDGLLELIRTKPGKKSKYEIAAEAEVSAQNILKCSLSYMNMVHIFFSVYSKTMLRCPYEQ